MTYTTNAVKINADKPRQLNGKTAQEIVAYMQEHYKSSYLSDAKTGRHLGERPENKCTAYLIKVFNALCNPEDWKAPFYARFPECGKEWVKAVAIWYHADEGYDTFSGAGSRGYQAW